MLFRVGEQSRAVVVSPDEHLIDSVVIEDIEHLTQHAVGIGGTVDIFLREPCKAAAAGG